jgi:SIR2-like domain
MGVLTIASAQCLNCPISCSNVAFSLNLPVIFFTQGLPLTSDTPTLEEVKTSRHLGRTISEAPSAEIMSLARIALQQRLVIYAGAGLSVEPPSCGPTGWQVADSLRQRVADILGVEVSDLGGLNLEEISERVEMQTPERLGELRDMAAETFDFRGLEPNYGHEIAALLLREGLLKIISANWDCAIERAGLQVEVAITGVATLAQCLHLASELPIYKVHGCANHPETLALTQNEVDRPQTWASAQVLSALTSTDVVFVGLGTVGLYVQEPVAEILNLWSSGQTTIHVVDPVLSSAWRAALGTATGQVHHDIGADEFFDQLIRAIVIASLGIIERSVEELARHEAWAVPMIAGFRSIRDAIHGVPGDAVLRWWRDGVIGTQSGTPFITELRGQHSLMTIALIASLDEGPVTCNGVRGRMTMESRSSYYEIACRPGAHVSEVERISRARVDRRRSEAVYGDTRPVVVVISGAIGQFPAPNAPLDIAEIPQDRSDISDVFANVVRIVAAEDGVHGRLTS